MRALNLLQQWKNRNRGLALEQRVVRLFRRRGAFNVRRSVRVRDRFGNMSEIDVIAGIGPFRTYIECKNYSNTRVPLEDVAKFAAVLALNGIPQRRGLFITTSTYVPRARTIGLRTVDGAELVELERTAARVAAMRYVAYAAMLAVPVLLVVAEFTDLDEQAMAAASQSMVEQRRWAEYNWHRLCIASERAYIKAKDRTLTFIDDLRRRLSKE